MRSVRFKIALSMFLLSLLAMAVVLYTLFQPSLESLRNNEIHYNVEATNQTKYAFSSLFDSVHKTVRMLSNNTAIHSPWRRPRRSRRPRPTRSYRSC